MIYERPIIRQLGDRYFAVEFSDDADLAANFRVLQLVQAIEDHRNDDILDVIPSVRELGIITARGSQSNRYWQRFIEDMIEGGSETTTVRSRRYSLPVWYRDPWSVELAETGGERHGIDAIAEDAGISTDEAILRHSETDHWLACVGWGPGCYFAYPLNTEGVSVSKLRSPRPFTPVRTLNLGGTCTAAMPLDGPSGYHMLGRLAAPIYEPVPRTSGFPATGVLHRAGDRHNYIPVGQEEYEEVQARIADGTYEYDIVEEDFDVTGPHPS